MGVFNRTYWRDQGGGEGGAGGLFRLYFPRPTPAVIGLMVACGVMFFLPAVVSEKVVRDWIALSAAHGERAWALLTFQFLHDGPGHLIMNMLGLYFFGPPLEREWGARRFLAFYLLCGCAAGGVFLLLAPAAPPGAVLVGASGGVLACMAACAVLMPQISIILIPIRWAAVGLVVIYLVNVGAGLAARSPEGLGDAAHLGGMIAGGLWTYARRGGRGPVFREVKRRLQRGAWKRKMEAEGRRRAEVDRILDQVHREGIQSLSEREKETLQEETRRQRDMPGPYGKA